MEHVQDGVDPGRALHHPLFIDIDPLAIAIDIVFPLQVTENGYSAVEAMQMTAAAAKQGRRASAAFGESVVVLVPPGACVDTCAVDHSSSAVDV